MHAAVNPFTPGAGTPPFALVGRDGLLAQCEIALDRLALGRNANGIVVYGLRGTGKTVLLHQFVSLAADRNWIAVPVEASLHGGTPFVERLSGKLSLHLRRLVKPAMSERAKHALGAFKSFTLSVGLESFSVGLDIDPQYLRPYSGVVDLDLPDMLLAIARAAAEDEAGILIAVDEMQDLSAPDLTALIAAAHEASQTAAPLLVCGTGLPSLPRVLAESKSYSERLFDYSRIGALNNKDARRVLVEPVQQLNEKWVDDGLDVILECAHGYPYFLQVFGKAAWDAAAYSPIDGDDAAVARSIGFDLLDQGFFLIRWDRATRAEREYLRAMAVDGDGPSSVADVAKRRDTKLQSLGPIRARLIAKGIVFSPGHGTIAFTVPGFATFIRRADEHGW